MLYKVFARTKRTDWVEINAFESEDEARTLMREIINSDAGTEVMMETSGTKNRTVTTEYP